MIHTLQAQTILQTLYFYKENGIWYADLPKFLAAGLGTKSNLMMVDGSDTFLDFVSHNKSAVTINISTELFAGYNAQLIKEGIGMNADLLDSIGHAPVNYGAYYNISHFNELCFNHRLWLCPVTEYVFGGIYPDEIYIQVKA